MPGPAPVRILLEQVRTEDELGLRLRAGRVDTFAVEAEPVAPLRAADGLPPVAQERGGPGEHLLIADVAHVREGRDGDVVAVLACPGFAAFVRRPRSAVDVGLLARGTRVSVRCVLSADAYDGLVWDDGLLDLPRITRTWLVEGIDLLDETGSTAVLSTHTVGRDDDATFLLTCRPADDA